MEIKVSVLVPCYNNESTISRSIESIYSQKGNFKIELIVVNDGSLDSSRKIVEEWIPIFKLKGYELIYVEQENQGPGGAINTGLKYVSGKYLTLLDADDCFLQSSIQKRVDYLEKNLDYVGVRTNGWKDKQGKRKLFDLDPDRAINTNLFDGLIGGKATNWAGSYMIRTEVLFDFYPTREIYVSRFGQHMQLLLPVAYKNKFGYIDEPLMIYFLQNNSHSQASTPEEQSTKDDRNFYGYYDIYIHMINEIVKDSEEKKYYLNIVESWKYRHELKKAIEQRDKNNIQKYFKCYKLTGRVTLNEKIEIYSKIRPVRAMCLKCYRRMLMLLGYMRGK